MPALAGGLRQLRRLLIRVLDQVINQARFSDPCLANEIAAEDTETLERGTAVAIAFPR